MAMRVTQQMIYTTSLDYMNSTLSSLMASNEEASSQKKINQPSDDPVGMTHILQDRSSLAGITQYNANITTAKGWLGLADSTMTQVSTVVTSIQTLAQEASTGTMTADNRNQIATQVRQYFDELVSLSNTQYDGQSLFAGTKTGSAPFTQTLGLTTNQPGVVSNAGYTIEGSSSSSVLVQFLQSGTLSNGTPFRYSSDGGTTWNQGTVTDPGAPNKMQLSMGGVTLELNRNTSVVATSATNTNDTNGTWLWVRPTVQYTGTADNQVTVNPMQGMGSTVTGSAQGVFSSNIIVRVDSTGSLASNVSYSYSLDGGETWKISNSSTPHLTASSVSLNLPGGVLTLHSNGGNQLIAGNMFVVTPSQALINVNISPSETIALNGVGKDIFGGIYQAPGSDAAVPVVIAGTSGVSNLFETVGQLVGYLETNTQSGVQQCLANLKTSDETILNYAADVGGRENRLTTASAVLTNLNTTETSELSNTEDVDLSALMTNLASQQLAYESVLKSTSMIMGMSLMNYLST
jgi:flagellar hook-associated protein 3 FlgL